MAAPGTFCWHEIASRDRAKAKGFYTGLFGWEAQDVPMPGDQGTYTLLRHGGKDLAGLFQMDGPQFEGVPPHWMGYVLVKSADESIKRAATMDAKVLAEPFDVPGVGRMAVFQDPTGATISIFQPGDHTGSPGMGREPGAICWNELATRDAKTAGEFYGALFGWTRETRQMPHMEYTSFKAGEEWVGGMLQMTKEWPMHIPSHWMYYVSVKDAEKACARVKELGGNVCHPPTDIPEVGRFAVIDDPAGATFSVIKLLPMPG